METIVPETATALAPDVPARSEVPKLALSDSPTFLQASDRRVTVCTVIQSPHIVVLANLLSDDECDELIALASPRLELSTTMDHASGRNIANPGRSSETCMFDLGEFPVCERIERRLAELLSWPVQRGEGLQVLRYGVGTQYEPHYDYFDPAMPGTTRLLQLQPQRVATMLMYLKTPECGGATAFPYVGLDVAPIKGSAVFFSYDRPHPETRTLHAGKPVLRGEKYVATKWFGDLAWKRKP